MALMSSVYLPLAAVREQVQSSVDLVVQVGRGPAGDRLVTAVDEVERPPLDGSARASATRPLVRGGEVVERPSRPARVVGRLSAGGS
jgi:hypothetical protein